MKLKSTIKLLAYNLFTLSGVFAPGLAISQGLINNGAKIVITNNSNIYINGTTGNYKSQNAGIITNNTAGGTVTLAGNWVNNAANTGFSNDGSTVVFNSSSAQTIGGTNSTAFYNITSTGTGIKTVNTASTVSKLVTVNASSTLNSNGNITLLATATTNANVGPLLSGASVTGNVNVQSYFTGGTSAYRGTRAISPPINETGLSSKTYAQLKNYMVITGPGGTANGFDAGGTGAPYAVTLNRYNEPATMSQSQFTPVATISTLLPAGNGALVFYRGNRNSYSSKVNAPYALPESQTIQYTGPVNQGNITVNLSYTSNSGDSYVGYNLIGNPYPSVIDWRSASITKVNVNDELKMIKAGGGYATYFNNETTNAGTGVNLRYIQPGEAFYARATSSGASVTFTENAKAVSNTPVRFLYNAKEGYLSLSSEPAPLKTSSSIRKRIKMNLQDDLNTDETVAVFEKGYSADANLDDAIAFGGSTVSLSTIANDNTKLTINFLPEISEISELKLSVNASASGDVKLNFTDLSAAEATDVYVKDNLVNKTVNVKAAQVYAFSIDKTNAASYGDNRLSLVFIPQTTLPVTLASFKAEKVSNGALLSWVSASEINFSRFEIERSLDAITYQTLGAVDAGSKKTYSFTDLHPDNGTNYYRLKQFDNNGKFSYSKIESINYQLGTAALAVYPNPTTDKINVDIAVSGNVKLLVFDLSGKELKNKLVVKGAALQENVADLQAGVYVLQVIDALTNTTLAKEKFIKK